MFCIKKRLDRRFVWSKSKQTAYLYVRQYSLFLDRKWCICAVIKVVVFGGKCFYHRPRPR